MTILPEPRSSFDMVICEIRFDDSRMFDLLQHVRNVDHYEKLPFLVIATELTASSLDTTIRQSAEMLGAYGFLQLQKLTNQEAEEQLRKAVREGFNCPVKVVRADSKVRKHG